jgi:hypothetical protein
MTLSELLALKARRAIECLFGKLKHYRRIATRYEKHYTWGCCHFARYFYGYAEMSTEPRTPKQLQLFA